MELALRGVFAGNLFDLGAAASAAHFETGGGGAAMFTATRDSLLPRPWAVDDLSAAVRALTVSFQVKVCCTQYTMFNVSDVC
jgi:damage-control phosphatase, subfamily II, stand-alone protein